MRCSRKNWIPGLFRRPGDPQEKKDARITQFLDVLKRAIGA